MEGSQSRSDAISTLDHIVCAFCVAVGEPIPQDAICAVRRLRAENERLKASVANWERRFDAWQEWRLFEALGGSQAKGSV